MTEWQEKTIRFLQERGVGCKPFEDAIALKQYNINTGEFIHLLQTEDGMKVFISDWEKDTLATAMKIIQKRKLDENVWRNDND